MKLFAFILLVIMFVPGCCWSRSIPRCNTCTEKPLDYSYDDTQYNDEINL